MSFLKSMIFRITVTLLCLCSFTYAKNQNQALFDYVTIEILKREDEFITHLPENISHTFNVTFVFPGLEWNPAYENKNSDTFYCFKEKLRRRLRRTYYKGHPEYVDSHIVRFRNETTQLSYVAADFTMTFVETMLWPAWNRTKVTLLFPEQLRGLVALYKYPEVPSRYLPFVNYTALTNEWFDVIRKENNMFDIEDAYAFLGFYDVIPPTPSYKGPKYFSVLNLTLYSLIGFNISVIMLALLFWGVNHNRGKLLYSYWFKEDLIKASKEKTPGDM